MPKPQNTNQLRESLEAIADEYRMLRKIAVGIQEMIDACAFLTVHDRLAEAAVRNGMPEPEAGRYASDLKQAIGDLHHTARRIAETVDVQLRTAGSAQHIVSVVPHRTPARLGRLDLD